jgi:hypothetical protein
MRKSVSKPAAGSIPAPAPCKKRAQSAAQVPDFLERLRAIYDDKVLAVSGAELVSEDRNRY